ncbi:armadillo-type protein [Mycena metata]|uniref:Armadillo-type protein n=1 Tax=Mycena metata TaxID=1033252 RepID=A0AAD7H019_9AGAR|nr:armadillo-type protein [Mycena metata]
MPPLTRQRTPQSLYSEWSRSYLGATISIHALAKPLMKRMYHRAVLDLIKQQQGIPLSAEIMKIYESYLMSKYVAETTKTHILRELEDRARVAAEARVVADFLLVYDMLLDPTDVMVRRWTCCILAALTFHSSTRGAIVAVHPCARLVALLGDGNVDVVSEIVDGAKAAVEAGALEIVHELLESQDAEVQKWAAWFFAEVASHSSTREAVVSVHPCERLVALLGGDVDVVTGACCALYRVCRELDGAKAAVEAGALKIVRELLKSQDTEVQIWAAWFFAEVASHSSMREAVVTVQPGAHLVALLSDANVNVVKGACFAVFQISCDRNGATLIAEAGALAFLKQLLESHDEDVQMYACSALGQLAFHSSTQAAVVAVQPGAHLFSDSHMKVVKGACYTLSHISRKLDGAKAAVEAGALEIVQQLLESQDAEVRRWAAGFFTEVAFHPQTRRAVLAVQPCARLVALLGDGDGDVVTGACCALYQVCRELDGARAAVEAGALKTVEQLLKSHDKDVRTHACSALGQLASHSSTRAAVVAVQPWAHLVALLSDANVNVVKAACYAVSHISRDRDGATLVVEAGAPEFLKQLLQSLDKDVRSHACWALGQLASHSSTRAAVVAVQPGAHLVALLSDANVNVVKAACYAVSHISRDRDGATPVVEARVPKFLKQLLQLLDKDVRSHACWALGQLASHSSARAAVVAVQPGVHLVALLSDANVNVVKAACYAVSQISSDQDGATPITEAGAPVFLKQLLESH